MTRSSSASPALNIDKFAGFDPRTGSATINGTATCTGESQFAFLETQLAQNVGRFTIWGSGSSDIACDGTAQPFSVQVSPRTGSSPGARRPA